MARRAATADGPAIRLLRLAIRAYPRDFRGEFAAPMLQAVRDGLEDVGGALDRLTFWGRAVRDIVGGGLRMRGRRLAGRPEPAVRRQGRPPGLAGRALRQVDITFLDLVHATRSLARRPVLTSAAVITLATAIGLTTLTFGLAYGATLRELPYPNADRLVDVVHYSPGDEQRPITAWLSFPLRALGNPPRSFSAMGEFSETQASLGDETTLVLVPAAEVSPGLFELLGVQPRLGRTFTDEDAQPGAPPAVILSDELWRTRFAADPRILGRTVKVDNVARTIVGVMPEGFAFSYYSRLWVPHGDERLLRGYPVAHGIVARLRDDVGAGQANAELESIRRGLAAAGIRPFADALTDAGRQHRFRLEARPLGWERWEELGWTPFSALLPVGLALLVACANVAGLLLARGVARRHEMTLRTVIGGSRARLMRQLMTESLVLACAAGLVGTFLVSWSGALLRRAAEGIFDDAFPFGFQYMALDSPFPGWIRLQPDGLVLLFTVIVTAVVVALIGLVPAREALSADLGAALRARTYGATTARRSRRWQATLTTVQVAVSVILVCGASLTFAGATRLAEFDRGIDRDRALEVHFGPPREGFDPDTARTSLVTRSLQRYAALPEITSATSVWEASRDDVERPTNLVGNSFVGVAAPEGLGRERSLFGLIVGPAYFETLGLRVLRGRGIDERDTSGSPRVAVISESVALLGWPDDDPMGSVLRLLPDGPGYTVIGVVEDQRRVDALRNPRLSGAWRHIYVPAAQLGVAPRHLVVRTTGDPADAVETLRRIAHDINAEVPLSFERPSTHPDDVTMLLAFRWSSRLLAVIGIAALTLSGIGIFGVVAAGAARRSREMGLRAALGADRAGIVIMILRESVLLATKGVVIGAVGSMALGKILAGLLYGVSPFDPATYAGVAMVIVCIALLAGWQTARRAAAMDPAVALRED